MSKPKSTQQCGKGEATERLAIARAYLTTAEDAFDDTKPDEYHNVAVGNAVTAAIAASDAICCMRLGQRHKGDNHPEAAELLAQATEDGKALATALRQILNLKSNSQYGGAIVATAKAKKALRNAAILVKRAQEELER